MIHNPPNEGPITELWAWVSVHEHGEGILGADIGLGGMTPLVTGKRKLAHAMSLIAQRAGEMSGVKVKLLHFVLAEEKTS